MESPLSVALSALDKHIESNQKYPGALVIRARVRAMLRSYDSVWSKDNEHYEVLGAEDLLLGPIANLATGKTLDYQAGGKIDVRIRDKRTGMVGIIDHKNLSYALEEDDIDHLQIDGQPNQYAYIEHLNGHRVDFAIWDVLCKTQHSPYKESKKKIKGSVRKNRPEEIIVTPGETLQEFEDRLVSEVYLSDPKKYFARERVTILKSNMIEHVQELYDWTRLMDSAFKIGKHLRNTEFCFDHNRPCAYLGICTGKTSPTDTSKWIQITNPHQELDLPSYVDPKLVVTNSRMKTFKGCPKKHYYKYVVGLKKAGYDNDDNLFVGTASHIALEQYWLQLGRMQGKSFN